jgi:hypothetical protein
MGGDTEHFHMGIQTSPKMGRECSQRPKGSTCIMTTCVIEGQVQGLLMNQRLLSLSSSILRRRSFMITDLPLARHCVGLPPDALPL